MLPINLLLLPRSDIRGINHSKLIFQNSENIAYVPT
jgi:hypothetical protein